MITRRAMLGTSLLLPLVSAADEAGAARLKRRLEWFQDQKFGFMLHWGPYSQMGCIESWPLVYADRKWGNPGITTKEEMVEFRKRYFALNRTFNPVAFDPNAWAAAATHAGMKYVVFTTKHHDGFSMFDTRQTDYRITSPEVPFSKNPRANITAEVFKAFRARGFGIGAYFSKSDWHTPYYWSPDRFAEDRNPNYDIAAEPERWAKFVKFVHGQVGELMTGYGPIDILWMDGGQVRPPKQEIQMDSMVTMARSHQPNLIVVNRASKGLYEDYRTPEQEVPDKPLDYVWESCMTMGKQWSYKPDDQYKSSRDLVRLLVDIVAKGGNLLLNVGPGPDGRLPAPALERMKEIGDWMKINGDAIYGTRPIAPYRTGDIAFTKKGNTLYGIYLLSSDSASIPERIEFSGIEIASKAKAELLGATKGVRWQRQGNGVVVDISPEARKAAAKYAVVIRFRDAL